MLVMVFKFANLVGCPSTPVVIMNVTRETVEETPNEWEYPKPISQFGFTAAREFDQRLKAIKMNISDFSNF